MNTANLEVRLGRALRRARLDADLDQLTICEAAGISDKALRNLELGRGAKVATLVAVVRVLGRADWLDALAPEPGVDPLALAAALRGGTSAPRRASRRRKREP